MGRYVEIRKTHEDADTVVYTVRGIGSRTRGTVWIDRASGELSPLQDDPPAPPLSSDMGVALHKLGKLRGAETFPDVMDFIS